MASIRARQRAGGTVYSVLWRTSDGTQTSVSVPDERTALNYKRLIEANGGNLEMVESAISALSRKVPSLTDMLTRHIDGLPSATQRSRADYRRDAKIHIQPYLGARAVDEITREHVTDWLRKLGETEMADKTIANVHGLLSATLKTAVHARLRPDNPCEGLRLPRRNVHTAVKMRFLTVDEWEILDGELGRVLGGWHQMLFRTLYLTGMRWGEAIALQVGDLSFAGPMAQLSISRASRRDENSRSYIGPTKTQKSVRVLTLDPAHTAAMKEHVRGKRRDDLVFTSRTGTEVLHSNVRSRVWIPATDAAMDVEKHGDRALVFRPRVHDLRHTHASMQIAAGTDLLSVQYRLGHESLKTTADRYAHLMPGQQLAAAQAAAGFMRW